MTGLVLGQGRAACLGATAHPRPLTLRSLLVTSSPSLYSRPEPRVGSRPSASQHPASFLRVVGPDGASGDHVTGFLDGALYLLLFGPAARKRYGDHAGGWICLGLRDVL